MAADPRDHVAAPRYRAVDMNETEKVERQEERAAAFHEAEAKRLREKIDTRPEPGLLEPPYCQVLRRNAVVLLTPEMIDFILYAMQDFPTFGANYNTDAAGVESEMWRAKGAIIAAARNDPEVQLPEGWRDA